MFSIVQSKVRRARKLKKICGACTLNFDLDFKKRSNSCSPALLDKCSLLVAAERKEKELSVDGCGEYKNSLLKRSKVKRAWLNLTP